MEFKDYYKILGVERDAPQDSIKPAYRRLARKFHPDVNKDPGTEAQFKEVGEAYEMLDELCQASNVDANWIAELVEHGVVQPIGGAVPWRFTSVRIIRVAEPQRLERDLGLNVAGVAMVLDLIEEIDSLRARLMAFEAPAGPDADSST